MKSCFSWLSILQIEDHTCMLIFYRLWGLLLWCYGVTEQCLWPGHGSVPVSSRRDRTQVWPVSAQSLWVLQLWMHRWIFCYILLPWKIKLQVISDVKLSFEFFDMPVEQHFTKLTNRIQVYKKKKSVSSHWKYICNGCLCAMTFQPVTATLRVRSACSVTPMVTVLAVPT